MIIIRLKCSKIAKRSFEAMQLFIWYHSFLEEVACPSLGGGSPTTSPCSMLMMMPCLHSLACSSQSLCWQNGPQYLARLQPEQVSLAGRPQFQQHCDHHH